MEIRPNCLVSCFGIKIDNTLNGLDLDKMQFAVEFLKFDKFADEEVAVSVRHLRVGDVDHVVIDVEVELEQYNIPVYIKAGQ